MDGGEFVFLMIVVIMVVVGNNIIRMRNLNNKKKKYMDAISQGDKAAALINGRAYYASMRTFGNLTIYDEQAIANDLSTMK